MEFDTLKIEMLDLGADMRQSCLGDFSATES